MVRSKTMGSTSQLSYALSVVGDRWTLLIMRELRLGTHHFDEIQTQTGMSSHLLRNRLRRMEADGILERQLYHSHPPRYAYQGTAKGKDLDLVLLTLRNWAMRWGEWPPGGPAVTLRYRSTNEIIDPSWQMPHGEHAFSFDDVDAVLSEAFRRERALRVALFEQSKRIAKKPRKRERALPDMLPD
jgi:DNA-binding HxlR family transcriptional regulator